MFPACTSASSIDNLCSNCFGSNIIIIFLNAKFSRGGPSVTGEVVGVVGDSGINVFFLDHYRIQMWHTPLERFHFKNH